MLFIVWAVLAPWYVLLPFGPRGLVSSFRSSLGSSGSTAGGVRSSTAVSVVSPCAVTPLGEPALVLLVLTPVSQRAVRQCDLAVGAWV